MPKGITERTEELGSHKWEPGIETAPSVLKEDEPTLARSLGLAGASCVIFGGAAILFHVIGWNQGRVGVGLSTSILLFGVVGLLSHAAFDRDLQVRRLYGGLGLALIGLGAIFCIVPTRAGIGGLFGLGYPSMGGGLLFLLAVRRHETDVWLRELVQRLVGSVGLAMGVIAFLFGNNFRGEFLLPYGSLLALMGLAYLAAFLGTEPAESDWSWRGGWLTALLGAAAFLEGLLRSVLPPLLHTFGWLYNKPELYIVPWGLTLMGLGLLYLMLAVGHLSDRPLVVLTRRELAAFFLSPMAYIVFAGLTLVGSLLFWRFVSQLLESQMAEPIVSRFLLLSFWPILIVTFIVPVLTMRLLSEEKRTGTLEVLLTAPVNETTVVLSKFLAALLLFVLSWVPLILLLVGLRVLGGQPFDFRVLYTFFLVLLLTGAAFVSMGLFFSSLTHSQIISAVLTFAGMLAMLIVPFLQGQVKSGTAWHTILTHVSYVDAWLSAFQGVLVPKLLLFFPSITLVWLFLTVKVLESRKWK
jgi:hypothetical protein